MAGRVEFETTRGFRIAAGLAALVLAAAVAGLAWQAQRERAGLSQVRIAGGGFLANYRLGEMRAGVTVILQKPVPAQSRLVATFEDPAGGPPLRVETRIRHGASRYGLETPALSGVVRDRPYQVTLELFPYGASVPSETHRREIRSDIDQALVPTAPLTIGPGYHRAPEPVGR